ncbi:uncharacterized protein LOC112686707 [Sipha flava]|uniref:Uncharacterized protein LOC112686707 n=1 Tax=Sipha flava TaxID=143950 RepID=A0A8B8FX31_9HEMI|nr:uncharacterized protein LOC112686707 [Sipha flava]
MAYVCQDLYELKLVVRCAIVATLDALTIEELWKKVIYVFGGPSHINLNVFGYDTFFDFLKSIPDVVQLEDPEDTDSIVNLVSSELSRHMEVLVSTNIIRPPSLNNNLSRNDILVPYRLQCAFIRIFAELYPEGLSIEDFHSNVLCIPLFRSLSIHTEALISNLDHIFQRNGLDMICLQPSLVKSLREIKEENKFTAMDIYNIDENSLENEDEEKKMINGLEYQLFYILEESIKNNIELLLDENEHCWISERNICTLYIEKYGSSFSHFRRWGFNRVSHMFSKLPELCCIHFIQDEVEIISVKNHICDLKKDLVDELSSKKYYEFSISKKDKSEKEPDENDGALKTFLKNDPFFKASLNDCFLDQKIKKIELQIDNSLNVHVCRVNTNIIPTIICQPIDTSQELQHVLNDMKKYYFVYESFFVFEASLIMMEHTYAFFLDDLWFRGIVIDIKFNVIKMLDIDNGSIHLVPIENIRLLCKKFSHLPAQAITCHLHGIEDVDEDELTKIVNKNCTISIVSINQNKSANVNIKLMDSTSDDYLNNEWIKNGIAEPDSSSDDE